MEFNDIIKQHTDENGNIDWLPTIHDAYRAHITEKYPKYASNWCTLTGIKFGYQINLPNEYSAFIYGNSLSTVMITYEITSISTIPDTYDTLDKVREYLIRSYNLSNSDTIFIFKNDFSNLLSEFSINEIRNKIAMNLNPMKIFLSHKSKDKSNVREFKNILQKLGFSPWLDEEELKAGDKLNRSLLKGMQESCAAIFFITDNYEDTQYLSDEIDYAKNRAMEDPNFKIIILVFNDANHNIPQLFRNYVWKNVNSDLSALGHIIDALPLQVGEIRYK